MKSVRFLAALTAIAFSAALLQAAEPQKIGTVEGITEYRLDNGMQVLLFPDPSKPTVTVNLTVFVGSRHEGYGETGMAHLLEHMVFKGTPSHRQIPKALQERGAQFNGTTSYDRTNYFETLNATDDNLEFAIRLEADRMVNSFVKREDLLSEMTVVRSEFEMGENSPIAVLSQRMMATAYEWHNYGKTTIGNRSDIERVPIDNLQAFYRKYYQPDNAMVVVAGKFNEKKALDLVQKYFGAIPKPARRLDKTYTEEPAQDGERVVMLRRVGDVGVVGVLYHIPAGPHPDFPAVQVLEQILTTPPSGRLYKALVESKKAASVNGSAEGLHDPGVIEFLATVNRGSSLDEARDTLLAVIEGVASQGVTAEEVTRAKNQILNAREQQIANTRGMAVGMSNWAGQGDWRLYFLHGDRLRKVTPEDVQRVAAGYLQKTNRTVGMFLPTQKAERVSIPPTPDLNTLVASYKGGADIAAGEELDPTPNGIERRVKRTQLGEGIKVALLPMKTRNEMVNLQLTLRYGNAENLKELVTACGFLDELMLKGTKQLSQQQLQDELDRLKARLSTGFGGFGGGRRGGGGVIGAQGGVATFNIQAKRDTLPAVLGLLRQVLREPSLPADQFELAKRARLARLEQNRSDPMALAMRYVQRQLNPYPKKDIRYIPTIDEEVEDLRATAYEQVKKLYEEYLGAQAGELVIVGDFEPTECLRILGDTFAGWKARQPYARIERTVPANVKGAKEVISTPDKANATYFAMLVLQLRDDDPDYPALLMANYVLGGGSLSSRLGDRVRQKEGLSYTVASMMAVDSFDQRGSLGIFAICNPDNMGKVETAIREEIEKLLKDGISETELAAAKKGYLQQQTVARTSETGIISQLAAGLHRGRTMQFQEDIEKKIDGLTADQVNSALRNFIDPQKFVISTAGDFSKKGGGTK